jgi:hypothetical protein
VLAVHPPKNTAEVELICPGCGYRMMQTAARLRRETGIIMNADQNGSGYDANPDTENLAIGFDVFGSNNRVRRPLEPTHSL